MLLKNLCELHGPSGNEKDVRDYIIENIQNSVDSIKIDKIGNLIAQKNCKDGTAPRIMLSAHMDEVGLMITEITSDGFLRFQPIGHIDDRILISKPVLIRKEIPGVIGVKAIHLQKKEERKKALNIEDLYIDIGANSREEAEEKIKIGDYVTFPSLFESLGSDCYKSKALDDRAGCSVIIEILKKEYAYNLIAAFTVQEEVGLRGSQVVSNYIEADLAIIIESTMGADILDIEEEDWIVQLGKGPSFSIMDNSTLYKQDILKKALEIAEKYNIPFQLRKGTSGRNDAGNIHLAGSGIPTLTINIPCRYLHSMTSVISKNDYSNCIKLIDKIIEDASYIIDKNNMGD